MGLKDLFRKVIGSFFLDNFHDDSSMTMSEYEKLREEHDYNVENGLPTLELPKPNRIDVDLQYIRKKEAEALDNEIKTTGLRFYLKNSGSFLTDLLTFMKDNYDEAILLYDEMIKIKEEEHLPYLRFAIYNGNKSLVNYNGNILRRKYDDFFKLFDLTPEDMQEDEEKKIYIFGRKCDFWNNLNRYLFLMLSIFDKLKDYSENERDKFFDNVISNFQRIKEFNIDNLFIKFNGGVSEYITLHGQPRGISKRRFPLSDIDYEEENFYTDGKFEDVFNSEKQCVDIEIQSADFVIKNERLIYNNRFKSPFHFDEKHANITVYNLDFDISKLPSYEEIWNTECYLDSYLTLMYDKKCGIFREKVIKLNSLLYDLYGELDGLIDLSDELEVTDLLKEIINGDFSNLFSDDDLLMLDIAANNDDYKKTDTLLKERVLKKEKNDKRNIS